ncbi:MAG: acyltransferase [Pseudomonadota bacterium]
MKTRYAISDKLAIGQNSFGLLRILAACMVVLSHAWTVTGGIEVMEPLEKTTGYPLGWHAVHLFFALSGLLIAGSLANSKSLARFAWSRFLRIFPALFVVVIATILIAALVIDTSSWALADVVEYLARNFFLVGASASLPGIFADNPLKGEINIPLWTLKYEVMAYVSIVCLSALGLRFSKRFSLKTTSLVVLVICALIMLFFGMADTYGKAEHAVRLLFAFYLGVAAWHWRESLTIDFSWLGLLLLLNIALLLNGMIYAPAQILLIAYVGLWIGTTHFGFLSRLLDRQDYSYGIYIIGYPVQQAVVAYNGVADPWLNFATSLPFVLLLAAVSWNLVERPALKLKSLGFRQQYNQRRTVPLNEIQRTGLKL